MAANEDIVPEAMKTPRIDRLTLIPEKRAAVRLLPIAYNAAAPMRRLQKDCEPDKQEDKNQRTPWNRGTADHPKPNVLIPFRKSADAAFVENDLRNPPKERKRPDGDDQRRERRIDHDQSIDQSREHSNDNA